jgi:hypothetical protein
MKEEFEEFPHLSKISSKSYKPKAYQKLVIRSCVEDTRF